MQKGFKFRNLFILSDKKNNAEEMKNMTQKKFNQKTDTKVVRTRHIL